ncbi:MAG: transposase [Chloroflexi bacterium]|nr:transposase [Chloroflexota bacterium]
MNHDQQNAPVRYHRRSIRLPKYDYRQPGAYFLTICVQGRACLLGESVGATLRGCPDPIVAVSGDGEAETCAEATRATTQGCPYVRMTDAGVMVERWWHELGNRFRHIELDEFVVMPNHVHDIIHIGQPSRDADVYAAPLADMVAWFKAMSTNAYIRGVNDSRWRRFRKRLWQRNYYEHVVRDSTDLAEARAYIRNNPASWHLDGENPELRQGQPSSTGQDSCGRQRSGQEPTAGPPL